VRAQTQKDVEDLSKFRQIFEILLGTEGVTAMLFPVTYFRVGEVIYQWNEMVHVNAI
jgi:hypothetical protein